MAGLDFPTLLDSGGKAKKRKRQSTGPTNTPAHKTPGTTQPRASASSAKSRGTRRSSTTTGSTSLLRGSSWEDSASSSGASSESGEPDFILAENEHEQHEGLVAETNEEAIIPKDLIHRLLYHHFQDKTKITINTTAKELVCKYVEIFVREALARSSYMKQEADGGRDDGGDGFREVEDLEECAPLLVLDF